MHCYNCLLIYFSSYKFRRSVNVCDEEDQTCGRMPHGFFIMTLHQHTTRYL
jgi:hypothetical protein